MTDNSDKNEAYFVRKFFAVSDGVLDMEFGVRIYGQNGAFLMFTDENGAPVVEILLDHGKYTVLAPDGSYTDTGAVYTSSSAYFDLHVNLDKKTSISVLTATITVPIRLLRIKRYPLSAAV